MKLSLPRPARTSAAALVTVVSVLGVAGCSVFSPATVLKPYEPSDGSGTSVGDVQVRNALVVSAGVDQPGVVSVVLVNSSQEDASVAVTADVDAGEAPSQSYFVPAGRSVHIGDSAAVAVDSESGEGTEALTGWLQIPQVPAVPGETISMTFRVNGEDAVVQVPVLLPCHEYSTITPTPAADAGTTTASEPAVTCEPEVGEESSAEEE